MNLEPTANCLKSSIARSAASDSNRVLIMTWSSGGAAYPRAKGLADSLGAPFYHPSPLREGWPAPIRYAIQTIRTASRLVLVRPRHVVFTNPPVVAGLAVLPLRRLLRLKVWSDSHSGVFNDPKWSRFSRVNAWLTRRCAGVIVTNRVLADRVRNEGGRPVIVTLTSSNPRSTQGAETATLVAPTTYSFDEPVMELLEAARIAPEVHVTLTGTPPEAVRAAAPPNCHFPGWLSEEEYEALISSSRGVLCLTTRELTLQMAGFEAVEWGVPVLVSGTETLCTWFRHGGAVIARSHDPAELSTALRRLWHSSEALRREMESARQVMFAESRRGLEELAAGLAEASAGAERRGRDDPCPPRPAC